MFSSLFFFLMLFLFNHSFKLFFYLSTFQIFFNFHNFAKKNRQIVISWKLIFEIWIAQSAFIKNIKASLPDNFWILSPCLEPFWFWVFLSALTLLEIRHILEMIVNWIRRNLTWFLTNVRGSRLLIWQVIALLMTKFHAKQIHAFVILWIYH